MTVTALTDSEARQRAAGDFTTTFLVEAGAGTGKTAVLLDRLLSLLRTGRGRAERIAAITFSEKSAAELRQRLRAELEILLAGSLTEDEQTILYAFAADRNPQTTSVTIARNLANKSLPATEVNKLASKMAKDQIFLYLDKKTKKFGFIDPIMKVFLRERKYFRELRTFDPTRRQLDLFSQDSA